VAEVAICRSWIFSAKTKTESLPGILKTRRTCSDAPPSTYCTMYVSTAAICLIVLGAPSSFKGAVTNLGMMSLASVIFNLLRFSAAPRFVERLFPLES
jgi:hypothetical protein